MTGLGDARKVTEAWIDIDVRDRLVISKSGFGHAGRDNDKGNPGGVSPDRCLAPVGFLPEVPAVITGEYDDRIPFSRVHFELVQQASNLNVHVVDAGQVGLHHVFPFLLSPKVQNLFMHGPWLEQILVSIGSGQGLSVRRQVVQIVSLDLWQLNALQRKLFKVGLGRIERSVRTIEANGHQERFFAGLPPFLDCPFGYLVVPGLFIGMVMRSAFSPEIRFVVGKFAADVLRTIQIRIDLSLQLGGVSVGYFPTAYHPVAVLLKVLVQDHGILRRVFRSDPLHRLVSQKSRSAGAVEIPARALGIEAIQKTRPGGTALGGIAVSIGKQDTLSRKRVEVRGFTLWMPAHHAYPVVQVIYDDKYNIRLGTGNGDKRKVDKKEGFFHYLCLKELSEFIHSRARIKYMSILAYFLQEIFRAADFPLGKKVLASAVRR